MYKLYKDEFEELENPTLEDIMSHDVYGIRISNDTESDLPYLFKNSKYLLNDENLSSYRWFKHKSAGSEYKEFVSSSGIFCKIEHDKAIEFIKRYRGLYILESEQYEKLTKNEYSPYKEGRIETDITNIDNGGELSAYIKAKYYNLYIMYLLEQKIDHNSIVQINADEAASWLSLKLPLETIYAYDGTDVTIIYVSNGYMDKFGVKNGDKIELKDPYSNKTYKFEVAGSYTYDAVISVFMNRDMFIEIFDKDDDYYSGYFSNKKLTDIDDDDIASIITVKDLRKGSTQMKVSMGSFMDMVKYFGIIMFILLLFIVTIKMEIFLIINQTHFLILNLLILFFQKITM